MPQIDGGCLCGKVRYSANADPAFVGVCHCTRLPEIHRQRVRHCCGATEGRSVGAGQGKHVQQARRYRHSLSSGVSARNAARLSSTERRVMPGIVMIGAGTLDDPSWVKPAMQIFCDSAQPWVQLGGGLQSFAENADAG